MTKNMQNNENGYVALISILIIGAIGVSAATSMFLLGLGSSRNSLVLEQSSEAMGLADACIEEALQQIWNDDTYTGSGNSAFGNGSCSYSVSSSSIPKNITASGAVGSVVRKVSVTIDQVSPYLNLISWQEVAD